ncbi:hypothetical protein CCACVL1_22565, partial [Corchorus capsularis]
MYNQGSHNPQLGQGPQKPLSSLYQQRPPVPLPPLPHIQQGPSSFTSYQHDPAISNQIPPGGLVNAGQSYLHPPVQVHGGARLPNMNLTAQQKSLDHSHLGTQDAHNMPQLPPPVSASHPEVSKTHPPLRTLPPPPPPPPQAQGQTFYTSSPQCLPPLTASTNFSSSKPVQNASNLPSNLDIDKQLEDSSLRPSEIEPSEQPYHLVTTAASHSP